ASGNLYGTTSVGGSTGCYGSGCGTVFRLSSDGTKTTLYAFAGGNGGQGPTGPLSIDTSGNLYGVTGFGGGTRCGGGGCGTVFKLTPSGTEKVLYTFGGGNDGAEPSGGLFRDSVGTFYGTTFVGGGTGCGGNGCVLIF